MQDRPDDALQGVAILTARAGCAEALQTVVRDVLPAVRAEAGCQGYTLHVDRSAAERIVILEQWADQSAFDAHLAGATFKALEQQVGPLLAGAPELILLRAIA